MIWKGSLPFPYILSKRTIASWAFEYNKLLLKSYNISKDRRPSISLTSSDVISLFASSTLIWSNKARESLIPPAELLAIV